MNKAEFEAFLSKHIGEWEVTERTPYAEYVYSVISPADPGYGGQRFSLYDAGYDGIRISFYNPAAGQEQTIEHIYHWSDAYELLALGLTAPNHIRYTEDGTAAVNLSLGRKNPYRFQWDALDFDLLDGRYLDLALHLVKYGYIDRINTVDDEVRLFIQPHCTVDPGSIAPAILLDRVRNLFFSGRRNAFEQGVTLEKYHVDWDGDRLIDTFVKYAQQGQTVRCIVLLCAYLEYNVQCGTLYELLQKRNDYIEALHAPSGPYHFTWTQERWLKTLDESRFHLAFRIAYHYVSIDHDLSYETNRGYYISVTCQDLRCQDEPDPAGQPFVTSRLQAEVGETENVRKPFSFKHRIDDPSTGANLSPNCDICTMRDHCVLIYAAYIAYLIDCGREDEIEADREWFRQHKKEQRLRSLYPSFAIRTDGIFV